MCLGDSWFQPFRNVSKHSGIWTDCCVVSAIDRLRGRQGCGVCGLIAYELNIETSVEETILSVSMDRKASANENSQ